MTISAGDIKFRKSVVQTDTDANGGRKGMAAVLSGARHALFPRVTKAQLIAGIARYRKEFYCNENANDEAAYGVLVYLMRPSNAGDRFYLAKGTQRDIQAEFNRADYPTARVWMGVGQLETALSGGETAVSLIMSSNDYQFPSDGYLYLSDNTMTGQSIASDVSIGDSVTFAGGVWSKIANTTDITYPNGWCVAADEVLTTQETTNEEFLRIAVSDPVSWVGNVATIQLQDQVANAYSTAGTYGCGCIYEEEVSCSVDSWVESSAGGTYDETLNPLVLFNDGTVEDDWTLSFTSGTEFTVSGAYYGSVGTGSTAADFSPVNPDTGQPYFTLAAAGWGGSWVSGDTLNFTTHPSALPILLEQVVPAGIPAETNNLLPIGAYTE